MTKGKLLQTVSANSSQDKFFGTLKSVVESKLYGFIRTDSFSSDIFVSATAFKVAGITPQVGMILLFDVALESNRGLQAQNLELRVNQQQLDSAEELMATVKWYCERKGYGFVFTDVGDAFIHYTALKEAGIPAELMRAGFTLKVKVGQGLVLGKQQVLQVL